MNLVSQNVNLTVPPSVVAYALTNADTWSGIVLGESVCLLGNPVRRVRREVRRRRDQGLSRRHAKALTTVNISKGYRWVLEVGSVRIGANVGSPNKSSLHSFD